MTKLFFACDVSDLGLGRVLIQKTLPYTDAVKVGLEAMTAEDEAGVTLASHLRRFSGTVGRQVMWDIKIHDVGNTMENAAENITNLGSKFFTIHASASDDALERVAHVAGVRSMPLAVTVLTDLDGQECRTRFLPDGYFYAGKFIDVLVENFAVNAYNRGIRGFVCSAIEARAIKQKLGESVFIVTPAIRPLWAVKRDEQKRITTPTQAVQAGADAIVVGRPIYLPPPRYTEADAARMIKEELLAV